jgi:hypothetical protein
MSVSLFALKEALKIPPKCETKVLSENGKPSLITFNEKSTYKSTDSQKYSGTIRIKG